MGHHHTMYRIDDPVRFDNRVKSGQYFAKGGSPTGCGFYLSWHRSLDSQAI